MQRRTIYFSILMLLFIVISEATHLINNTQKKAPTVTESKKMNGEAKLALGKKLSICDVKLFELMLISGISDKLGNEILQHRAEIAKEGRKLSKKEQYHALEIIHGIGPKSAKKLGRFIDTRCKIKAPH